MLLHILCFESPSQEERAKHIEELKALKRELKGKRGSVTPKDIGELSARRAQKLEDS